MKQLLSVICMVALIGVGAFAADLTVESQFNVNGKDVTKSFLTVHGPTGSVERDSVDPAKVDTFAGASLKGGTKIWNSYQPDAEKAPRLPAGFQNMIKYAVSTSGLFMGDGLSVTKAADGVITIQYVHFGVALRIITDKNGKLDLEKGNQTKRIIGFFDGKGQVLSTDFAPSGTIKDVSFAKIWDATVKGGKEIGKTKTTDILPDAPSSKTPYTGTVQFTLKGEVLNIKAELNLKK